MSLPARLAFDEFELLLDSGELFRAGSPAAQLQPQPARLLELLASRSGEVVSRDEIRQVVWGDSFVDFDASLNFCVKQLRRALGDSSTSPRYIETLPRRGYRFLRPVRKTPTAEIALDGIQVPAPAPAPAPPSAPAARAGWRLPAGLAVTAAVLILLIVVLIAGRFPLPSHPRLAVFPLSCQSAQPVDRQICGGVTEALTAELTRRFPRDLELVAPTSSQVYEASGRSTRDVGKELGATHLLTGAVDTSGGRLRIAARLATTGGETLWRGSFDGDLMDAQGVYEQITRRVANTFDLPLPAPPATSERPSQEASENFLKGIYLRHQWLFAEASKALQDSILLAPRYAPAYAELALARTDRGVPPQEDGFDSRAYAQLALQLDPQLPEAHLAMANVLFKDFFDWKGSEAEYSKAMALGPGNAEILHYYANYLIAIGDFDKALRTMRRARELDPVSMEVESDYAWFLFLARHSKEAVQEAHNTLALLQITQPTIRPIADFGRSWAYHVLLFGSLRLGDEKTALSSGLERLKIIGHGDVAPGIRSVHDLLEWRHQFVAGFVPSHPGYSYLLAQTAAVSGRTGEALDALELECRNGGEGIMFNYIAVEPLFDPLHKDPRFAKIVDCTHLPMDAPARRALKAEAGG
jgi:DNA-binding winged helix-turn-helix (wHTH) protein/TolB-like protein